MNEQEFVDIIAGILKEQDSKALEKNNYGAGVGPFEEVEHVDFLKNHHLLNNLIELFPRSKTKIIDFKIRFNHQECYVEAKLLRPLRANGDLEENFFKLLFPIGKNSIIDDVKKLLESSLSGRYFILLFHYKRNNELYSFNDTDYLVNLIINQSKLFHNASLIKIGEAEYSDLIHPVQQKGTVILLEIHR